MLLDSCHFFTSQRQLSQVSLCKVLAPNTKKHGRGGPELDPVPLSGDGALLFDVTQERDFEKIFHLNGTKEEILSFPRL